MIVPVTRKEKLLNAIATNGNVDFLPKTREELFLFKILGADVNAPTPITRKEILYQHVADGTIPTFEPRTRLEKFIMAAAGVELELPVVLTREEYWWAEISDSAYETITGAIVHFVSKRARAIKSLIANISYTQDLHGYDSPWPAGGGKNLLWLNNGDFKTGGFRENRQLTGIGTWVGMSASNYLAPNNITSYTIGDNSLTVEAKSNGYGIGIECKVTAGQKYTLSWVGTNVYVGISFYDGDGAQLSYVTSGVSPKTFTVPESTAVAIIVLRADAANVTGEFSNVQLEEGQTATAYSPYANICPISGWDEVNVWVKPTYDPTANPTATIQLGQTVYGGTLDVTTGKLTVTHGNIASYNGETLPGRWISSMDVYSAGGTPTTGAQVVYELATPQTYQLTPTEVTTLLGENTIWADTGDVTVTY